MSNDKTSSNSNSNKITRPSVNLPKGGGAINGIGEKFNANAVSGTGSFSVPIALTAGRGGFNPDLALGYDSGSGNSVFGMGFSLSLPAITRKTANGLPLYNDELFDRNIIKNIQPVSDEAKISPDVFLLSGAEDLVPELDPNGARVFRDLNGAIILHHALANAPIIVIRFRPRIEGLFARIEKVIDNGNTYWRSISKENILTIYGKSSDARIYDPVGGKKIYKWLIERTIDAKGNIITYEYKRENSDNISSLSSFERQRLIDGHSYSNCYIKRVNYGNSVPYNRITDNFNQSAEPNKWHFTLLFDYGEHDITKPTLTEIKKWNLRPDSFSDFKAGFDLRTYRLCNRVLMLHNFSELSATPVVVKATEINYQLSPVLTTVNSIKHTGYKYNSATGSYTTKSLPPIEFEYTKIELLEQMKIKSLDAESVKNLPILDGSTYQWVDLYGEGISGILTEQNGAWFYKENLGEAKFGPLKQLTEKPSMPTAGSNLQITDLNGDGNNELLINLQNGTICGYYEYDNDFNTKENGQWLPFTPFKSYPRIDWNDPNLKMIDLNGDGHADILISEQNLFRWFPSKGKDGFAESIIVNKSTDEKIAPAIIFADPENSIYLADMNGDGLTDIVRITKSGSVDYWPNLGYGKFGGLISMGKALDFGSVFNPKYLKLADIDGSGTTDIFYFGDNDGAKYWLNQSGNSFSDKQVIKSFPTVHNLTDIHVIDLLGNGTSAIVWSSAVGGNGHNVNNIHYIDLMQGVKPHLLKAINNNLGKITNLEYMSSVKFYLADKASGKPWITKLPFPVHVLAKTESVDIISKSKLTTCYQYHHGYFDGVEREFRGFGMVEQTDSEIFGSSPDSALISPPVLSKSWFHLGQSDVKLAQHFSTMYQAEYFGGDPDKYLLEDTVIEDFTTFSAAEKREALRALKGSVLRNELYALDGSAKEQIPYTTTETNYRVKKLQSKEGIATIEGKPVFCNFNKHGVFLNTPSETLTYHYERNIADPRITHELVLETDNFGNVIQSASAVYPRRNSAYAADSTYNSMQDAEAKAKIQAEQQKLHLTCKVNDYFNSVDDNNNYLVGINYQSCSYEIGLSTSTLGAWAGSQFKPGLAQVKSAVNLALSDKIEFKTAFNPAVNQSRLILEQKTFFWNEDFTAAALLGMVNSKVLAHHTEEKVGSQRFFDRIFGDNLPDFDSKMTSAGYLLQTGVEGISYYFKQSEISFYNKNYSVAGENLVNNFYQLTKIRDPFGNEHTVKYDNHELTIVKTVDAVGNITTAEIDYRTLTPKKLTDPNGSVSEALTDELGMVIVTSLYGTENGINKGDLPLVSYLPVSKYPNPTLGQIISDPQAFLQGATSYFYYDLTPVTINKPEPVKSLNLARVKHVSKLVGNEISPVIFKINYTDGFGRALQEKLKVESGDAWVKQPDGSFVLTPNVADRWQVSGRIFYNNKQKPVKQYEPFYSATYEYDDERFFKTYGVTPLIHYDPLARVIQTDKPHRRFSTASGTVRAFFYSKVEFTPWEVRTYDENDTVLTTAYFKNGVINPALALSAEEIEALNKAKNLANLPAYVMLDSLGREFLQYMLLDASQQNAELYTFTEFDITGKPLKVTDPKQYQLNKSRAVKVYTYEYTYDMSGTPLVIKNIDSGEAKSLADVLGNPLYSLDAKLQLVSTEYDGLRRPVATRVDGGDYRNQTVEYIVYGENAPEPELYNLRGKIYRHYDQAGLTEFANYSFKGELLTTSKQLKVDYKFDADWSVDNLENKEYLEGESFSSVNKYDALGRIIEQINPDNSVFAPEYHQSGKLNKVAVKINDEMGFVEYVSGITYNPKGQREKIVYGNNTFSEYVYERESFRMIRQKTTRTTDSKVLQDLNYWYDPAGNIIKKVDNSQQDVYFNNQVVKAENNYIYDALNRLIEANGREHSTSFIALGNSSEYPRQSLPQANSAVSVRNYTRKYSYDSNGNISQFKHLASNNVWTNNYSYDQLSNKLAGTTAGQSSLAYSHDDNGNITSLGDSKAYNFDYRNNIQAVDLGGGGTAYYNYDGSGQRVRKIIEDTNGAKKTETIYLGGIEILRHYRRGGVDREIQTLHVMDDKARVALIETTTVDMSRQVESPVPLSRYQYSDHLGSSCIEADENGSVISFEEYFPFGGTSYHSVRAGIEVNVKRYRYNGKEKDTESGLYYYGARYYAPWLGRWMSADPSGPVDGLNLYAYVKNNPIGLSDPDGRNSVDDFERQQQSNTPAVSGSIDLSSHLDFYKNIPENLKGEKGLTPQYNNSESWISSPGSNKLQSKSITGWTISNDGGGSIKSYSASGEYRSFTQKGMEPIILFSPVDLVPIASDAFGTASIVKGLSKNLFKTLGKNSDDVGKVVGTGRSIKTTPSFYVAPDGTAIPGTGYRAISTEGLPFAKEGSISPPSGTTYFTFNDISIMSPEKSADFLQLDKLPSNYYAKFDVKQILGDIKIPNGKWNTNGIPEPITSTFPFFGKGGAHQAITNKSIKDFKLFEYKK